MARVELPPLTSAQQDISDRFVALMRDCIALEGAMPFSEYMQRSLYEPGLGYYVNGFSKLGKDGDFTTAPETSEHFAVCMANQCLQVFEETGPASILEFGGGSGRLAADILKTLDELDSLPERYFILDVSAEFQLRQRELLERELPTTVFSKVEWLQGLPENFTGVVLANEVLDAFAVERFTMVDGQPLRMMVGITEGSFNLHAVPDEQVHRSVTEIQNDIGAVFRDGYESEFCPVIEPWWQSLIECIDQGVVLICDYGADRKQYYSEKKPTGTLRCFYRHTLHDDPFARPAVQDITADVDFTLVTIAATTAGLDLQGYSPLSEFMLSLNVLEHHQNKLQSLDERGQIDATGKLKRVILSQEMGDRFMVIGFSKKVDLALTGFSRADWSRLL